MAQMVTTNVSGRVTKEKLPGSGGAWKLLSLMIFIFAVFLASYFGLVLGYRPFIEAQIRNQDEELEDLAKQVPKADQDEYIQFQYQLVNLKKIIDEHKVASRLFPALENNTISRVSYKNLNVEMDLGRITFRGTAASYEALAEQLAAIRRLPNLENFAISSAKLTEANRVDFDAVLFFKPEFFKFP